MKKLIIISILCAMFTMTSCGVEPSTPITSVGSSESERLSEKMLETTEVGEEKTKTESTLTSTTISATNAVVSTENSTKEEVNMKTETTKTIDTVPVEISTKEVFDTTFESISEEELLDDKTSNEETNDFIKTEQWEMSNEVLEQFKDNPNIDKPNTTYSADELINYICYAEGPNFVTFMYNLNEKYPIEHMVTPDKSSPYCIYNLNNGYKLFVFFDDDEDFLRPVTSIFAVKDLLTMSDFDSLECGMSLNDVESVDSGIKLINSIKASFLSENQTLHITSDGFVKITYSGGEFDYSTLKPKKNEDYIISSIEFIPNGSNFNFSSCGSDIECIFTLLEVNMETASMNTITKSTVTTASDEIPTKEVSDIKIENILEEVLSSEVQEKLTNEKSYEEIQKENYEEVMGTISDEPFESLITKTVSDDILTNFLDYHMISLLSNTVTPLEINKTYGIELIRDMGNGRMYAVQELESGAYFYTFYEDTVLNCTALISKSLTKGDFETIKTGSLISDVENIEPATVYWKNIMTSRINSEFNGDFTQSILLKDALLFISYERQNNDYYVSDMVYYDDFKETREYGVYDYSILSEDYPN